MAQVTITQVKSVIGCNEGQRRTVRALGLRKIGQTVTKDDTPDIRGMIFKVKFLLQVTEEQQS